MKTKTQKTLTIVCLAIAGIICLQSNTFFLVSEKDWSAVSLPANILSFVLCAIIVALKLIKQEMKTKELKKEFKKNTGISL